ncbi:MAG: type II toxin-antitoxin system VapC family toxin [Desulfobacterales bacterium]|nr:type II toxin-antitoxin system VapC family toxin [Desulfobacterales bacterium]
MNLLLDTHVLLWWLDDHPALSKLRAGLRWPTAAISFSSVQPSFGRSVSNRRWENSKIPSAFREILDQQSFNWLSITVEHAHALEGLPAHHRDPFDRMLVAQARVEGFTVVTHDAVFRKYKIPVMLT